MRASISSGGVRGSGDGRESASNVRGNVSASYDSYRTAPGQQISSSTGSRTTSDERGKRPARIVLRGHHGA